jgi:hypothetical protein
MAFEHDYHPIDQHKHFQHRLVLVDDYFEMDHI